MSNLLDVINDITAFPVPDFNKCIKIVEARTLSLCVDWLLAKIILCISGFAIYTQISRIL